MKRGTSGRGHSCSISLSAIRRQELSAANWCVIKLGGAVGSPEGGEAVQRDPDRSERWVIINGMKINESKCRIPRLG